jgi:molybdopterin adenylyltransferase
LRLLWVICRSTHAQVSDRASANETMDKTGPALKDLLSAQFTVSHFCIVPDDIPKIQSAIKMYVDDKKAQVLILAGGTGFSPRDVTPEVFLNVSRLGG